jgi:lactate permease
VLQFAISNFVGPTLVDIAAGLGSLVALALMLRVWQPRDTWHFDGEMDDDEIARLSARAPHYSRAEIASAWTPWVILSLCVFAWGMPQFRTFLNGGAPAPVIASEAPGASKWWERPNALAGTSVLAWNVPYLHHRIKPDSDVLKGETQAKPAEFKLNWLSATGTGILVASVLSAFWMRVPPGRFISLFFETVHRLRWSLFTISAMMAIAYLTQYSGSDVTLGLAFTRTGVLYPFFAAMLGWLGVALTGSDTSSNALFGNLQRITAERLGLNPILIATANSTGGVMGKMIDAQSIVVASAATGQQGNEGQILRFVFWPSVTLAALMGLLTLIQAYWLPWMIPGD